MSLNSTAFRVPERHEVSVPEFAGGRRLFLGAVQVVLALVFIPAALLVLVAVGVFMMGEWVVLRVDAAVHLDPRRLNHPDWTRFSLPVDGPIKG